MTIHEKKVTEEHLNDYQTAQYLDFLLSSNRPSPPGKIMAHVETCCLCRDKILDLILDMKKLHTPDIQKLSVQAFHIETVKKFHRSRSPIINKIAATFFLFAFFLTVYFMVIKTSPLHQNNGIPPDPSQDHSRIDNNHKSPSNSETNFHNQGKISPATADKTRLNYQNHDFKVNSNLEFMINSQTRNETIKVASPENQSFYQGEITFNWESFGIKPVEIKILNNKNDILFRYTIHGESFLFKEKLPPGLYYWKMENKNDLLYVGKFFVN